MILDETVKKCPCCGSTNFKDLWIISKNLTTYGVDIIYKGCQECLAYFMSPRMSEATAREFYTAKYRDEYVPNLKGYTDDWEVKRQEYRYKVMLERWAGVLPDSPYFNHLDIGCDVGMFLDAVREKRGSGSWVGGLSLSYGLEWNDKNAEVARSKGYLNIYKEFEELPRKVQFSLVTMSHVLEHMNEPLKELKKIYKRMAEGGSLLIEVPNAQTYPGAYAPVHPIAFNVDSLMHVVQKAGFTAVAVYTHPGLMAFPIGYYLDIIAKKEVK